LLKKGEVKRSNAVLKLLFVESLDLLLAACEDANIYVWGFDEEGIKILKNMKYQDDNLRRNEFEQNREYYRDYMRMHSINTHNSYEYSDNVEVDESVESNAKQHDETDSVANRVAGFVLKKILSEHTSCVTSLVAIERPGITYFCCLPSFLYY
jgi:hypothetical protein